MTFANLTVSPLPGSARLTPAAHPGPTLAATRKPPVKPAQKYTLLAVATLTIMAGTIVSPSLPAIRTAFAGEPNVELLSRMVLTLPALFVAMFAPAVGALADRFGRKRLLTWAILFYAIAGASGLVATSLTAILIGRAVLGLAIGAIMTIGTALVGDYFEADERARYLGLQQAFTQFGGVLFVVAGGLAADLHWRVPFAVYILALPILLSAILFLVEPPRAKRAEQAQASNGQSANWTMIALVCFTAFAINLLFYMVPSEISFFLRDIGLERPSTAGFAIGILNFAAAISALLYGRLRRHLDIAGVFAIGLALLAAGYAGLSFSHGVVSAFTALAVAGLGLGVVMPNILSAAIQTAPPAMRARITGFATSSVFLGHFLSPVVSQPVIENFGFDALYRYAAVTLFVMSLGAIIGVVGQRRAQRAT